MNEWRERKRSRGVSYFIHSLGYVRVCTMTQIKGRRWRESREEKSVGAKRRRERKERRGLIVMEMGVALVVVVVFCLFVGRDAVTGREWHSVESGEKKKKKKKPSNTQPKGNVGFFFFWQGMSYKFMLIALFQCSATYQRGKGNQEERAPEECSTCGLPASLAVSTNCSRHH